MKELGVEKDDKVDMIAKFALKIEDFEARKVDEKIMTVIKDEMQKLSSFERNSPEFNVTRSYLDWLTSVPWKVLTEDRSVYSSFTCIETLKSKKGLRYFYTPRTDNIYDQFNTLDVIDTQLSIISSTFLLYMYNQIEPENSPNNPRRRPLRP